MIMDPDTLAALSGVEIIQLPDHFYYPVGSGTPYHGAVGYCRSLEEPDQVGVLMQSGHVEWQGRGLDSFGYGAKVVDG